MIGQGEIFGKNQKVSLISFGRTEKSLEGLKIELDDCAFELLADISYTTDIT